MVTAYAPIAPSALGAGIAAAGAAAWAVDRWLAGAPLTSHGSSRWIRHSELRAICRSADHVDGAVIGWTRSRVVRLPDEDNLLVFGVQRSGKTSTVIVPTLLTWPGAVVATSTKEELVALTGRHRAMHGPVYVYAPLDSESGWITGLGLNAVTWNPVDDLASSGGAAELADVFTAEGKASPSSHWYSSAANLLTGLFLLARKRGTDISAVLDMLNATPLTGYVPLGREAGGRAEAILMGFARTPREEAGSIISTAREALSLWIDDRVAAATAAGSPAARLDLGALLEKGGSLYLVAPAEDAERCRPLFTALVGSLLRRATARAREQGGVLHPRLLLALDEAANFARVPRLESYVSTGPGQGIQSILCFHDLAQLRAGYRADGAATIWNNCRARLLLPGQADMSTLELISKSMGSETVTYRSRSWTRAGKSSTEARVGRPLQAVDQLRRTPDPILILGHLPPARLTRKRWDQVPRWKALVAGTPPASRAPTT